MNKQEVLDLIKLNEGQFIEFKENIDKTFASEIVAFSNSKGGKVLIGVDDGGNIKGINITNRLKSQIMDIGKNCDPQINLKLKEYENILIIDVKEGINKPYSCKNGFYLRNGPNSQKIGREEILKLSLNNINTGFDKLINEGALVKEELNKIVFNKFIKKYFGDVEIDENLMKSLKISKDKYLTNAGILLFGKNPKFFFDSAYLDCVLFKGKDKVNIIDRKTFEGNLFEQLEGAIQFLKRHLSLRYEFIDEFRKEIYEIPIRALEEGIVNSLIHRDYNFTGSNISINIYDDRVEIVNPGKLLEGLDENNFGKLSLRRNEILADIFARTPYVEKIGSGIKRIKELCLKNENNINFEFNSFFTMTIFKLNFIDEEKTREKTREKTKEKTREKIIFILKNNSNITIKELSMKLGISEKGIEWQLKKLKKNGTIKRKGADKGGYWEVLKND